MRTLITTAIVTATLLTGCSSNSSNSGTPVSDTTGGGQGIVNDGTGGFTGQAGGEPVDITINNDENLTDELITDGLLEARVAVLGNWILVDDASQCSVTLEFDANGNYRSTELDEEQSGSYEVFLETTDESTLSLAIFVERDNQLPDCDGSNADESGEIYDFYLSFPNDDTFRLSTAPGGFGEFIDYSRLR